VLARIGEAAARWGRILMRSIAGVLVVVAVASCAAVPNNQGRWDEPKPTTNQTEATLALGLPSEIRDAQEAQVRLDVAAMLRGMAAAHAIRLTASVPELQRALPE
jgi:hypothetical protein